MADDPPYTDRIHRLTTIPKVTHKKPLEQFVAKSAANIIASFSQDPLSFKEGATAALETRLKEHADSMVGAVRESAESNFEGFDNVPLVIRVVSNPIFTHGEILHAMDKKSLIASLKQWFVDFCEDTAVVAAIESDAALDPIVVAIIDVANKDVVEPMNIDCVLNNACIFGEENPDKNGVVGEHYIRGLARYLYESVSKPIGQVNAK